MSLNEMSKSTYVDNIRINDRSLENIDRFINHTFMSLYWFKKAKHT